MSIYEEAIEVFGVKDRHEKLAEEAAELTLAAIHILQGKVSPLELAEELEGIAMLREQFRLIYGDELLTQARDIQLAKLQRAIQKRKDQN